MALFRSPGQIRRQERRRRQLRSLNATIDSSGGEPPCGADRRDLVWSLSGTDRQYTVRNCIDDAKRLVCERYRQIDSYMRDDIVVDVN